MRTCDTSVTASASTRTERAGHASLGQKPSAAEGAVPTGGWSAVCDHDVASVEVDSLVDATPGFVVSVGCAACGERLRKRVSLDPRGERRMLAEHHVADDGDHVLVEPEGFGGGGTAGAWLKIDLEPVDLERFA